jgi:hypothetical protein
LAACSAALTLNAAPRCYDIRWYNMDTESQPHRAQLDVCTFMSQRGDLLLSLASAGDDGKVFDMVNLAYKVEDGDSGVAFKKTDRFLSHEEGGLSRAAAARN